MLVVADTSALVALAACDGLSFLPSLFQDLLVPPAVLAECLVAGKPEAERLGAYLQGKVWEIRLEDFVIAVAGLGKGELEAMALYKQLHADLLLADDHRARKVAGLNGIVVVGSLGVLLRAKEAGFLSQIRPLVRAIQAAGIHYSEQLVNEVLTLAGES